MLLEAYRNSVVTHPCINLCGALNVSPPPPMMQRPSPYSEKPSLVGHQPPGVWPDPWYLRDLAVYFELCSMPMLCPISWARTPLPAPLDQEVPPGIGVLGSPFGAYVPSCPIPPHSHSISGGTRYSMCMKSPGSISGCICCAAAMARLGSWSKKS